MWILCPKKTLKKHQNPIFLICVFFFEIACDVLSYIYLGYDKYHFCQNFVKNFVEILPKIFEGLTQKIRLF